MTMEELNTVTKIVPSITDVISLCVFNSVQKAMSEFPPHSHAVVNTTSSVPDQLCLLQKTHAASSSHETWTTDQTVPLATTNTTLSSNAKKTKSVYYEVQSSARIHSINTRGANGKFQCVAI